MTDDDRSKRVRSEASARSPQEEGIPRRGTDVVRHVIASIGEASRAHAEAARAAAAGSGAAILVHLARALAAAQHTPHPKAARKKVVVIAGDHGCGDPGIAMGADHPTAVAARAIADGSAALADVARAAGAPIVLVSAGTREAMPAIAVELPPGRPSRDITREPALTHDEAQRGLEAGIALSLSLDADVIALGAIGVGADVASAALLGAATGRAPTDLRDPVAEAAGARAAAMRGDLLAWGGPETAVLAGLILGCASINVPVILDSYATGSAALVATALAPAAAGYAIAAHRGSFTHPASLVQLGLAPVLDVGLGHGDGVGAAMILPMLDQVERICE